MLIGLRGYLKVYKDKEQDFDFGKKKSNATTELVKKRLAFLNHLRAHAEEQMIKWSSFV